MIVDIFEGLDITLIYVSCGWDSDRFSRLLSRLQGLNETLFQLQCAVCGSASNGLNLDLPAEKALSLFGRSGIGPMGSLIP